MADENSEQPVGDSPVPEGVDPSASGGVPKPETAAEAALRAAQEAIAGLQDDVNSAMPGIAGGALLSDDMPEDGSETLEPEPPVQQFALPEFGASAPVAAPKGIDLLSDVDLHVKIELGRTHMLIEDVLRLGEGAVVELDKLAGDPVDIYVNERHVARGEVLVLNDNFCVRINEILTASADAKKAS